MDSYPSSPSTCSEKRSDIAFYSDPKKEIDYDPPEFIPPEPSDLDRSLSLGHEDGDVDEEDKEEEEDSDTTVPNMYERSMDYKDFNHYSRDQWYHDQNRKTRRKCRSKSIDPRTAFCFDNVPVTPSGSSQSDDNDADTPTPSPPPNPRKSNPKPPTVDVSDCNKSYKPYRSTSRCPRLSPPNAPPNTHSKPNAPHNVYSIDNQPQMQPSYQPQRTFKWKCSRCQYENDTHRNKCEVCQSNKNKQQIVDKALHYAAQVVDTYCNQIGSEYPVQNENTYNAPYYNVSNGYHHKENRDNNALKSNDYNGSYYVSPKREIEDKSLRNSKNIYDKSLNDKGQLAKESKTMLKMVERIEKRRTKIDKNRNNIKEHQEALSAQREQFRKKLQFDKMRMMEQFKQIEDQFNIQYNIKQHHIDNVSTYLNNSENIFKRIHKKTINSVWDENSDRKNIKNEANHYINTFDAALKNIKKELVLAEFHYESYCARRYATYDDIVQNHKPLSTLFDEIDDENDEKKVEYDTKDDFVNKLVFVEGCLHGVVPMNPDRVDITFTLTYKEREKSNESGSDVDTEISNVSEISDMEVIKNIKIWFGYNDVSNFHRKSIKELQHEVQYELKNSKPIHKMLNPGQTECEWRLPQNLKIYEGSVHVRSKNINGWGQRTCMPFKFDEQGKKLPISL